MTRRFLSLILALVIILGVFGIGTAAAEDIKILGNLTIKVGETKPLRFTDPSGNEVSVLWESANPDIATVTSDGKVTGKKVGTCTITTWWNSKIYGVNLTVNSKKKVSAYSKLKKYLKKNGTQSDRGDGTTDRHILWYDDGYVLWANYCSKGYINMFIGKPNPNAKNMHDNKESMHIYLSKSGKRSVQYLQRSVQSVYSKEYKKGKKVNLATLKLKLSYGSKIKNADSKARKLAKSGYSLWQKFLGARLNLTVKKLGFVYSKSKTSLSKTKLTMTKGTKYTLKLKNAKASKTKWSSSNKKVAAVSKKGVVRAKKKGTATITAKYKSKKYRCKLRVR